MRDPVVGDRSAGGPRAEASARRRRLALSAVIVCITLPGAAAFVEGVIFYGQNRSTDFISVGEWKRGYVLHVPEDLDRSQPVPLIISLHGGFLWGATQRDISRWNDVADREGFIVAYPSGAGRASPRRWRGDPDDVEFITRLIDTLVTVNDVDPDRVYADGLSNGGGMAFALSCAIPDRIAAVGIVAGALTTASWGWEACAYAPSMPAVFVHGTADSATPYHGGETWVAPEPFPSIPAWVARWAQRNGCAVVPERSALAADLTRHTYHGCADGADVLLYTLHGVGHVWPGGGPSGPEWLLGTDSRSLNATEVLWDFFRERQRLAARSSGT